MSQYSNYTPITLFGSIASYVGLDLYGESDNTGFAAEYQTYTVSISSVSTQLIGDASTRDSNQYNGIDIEPGMFIVDSSGKTIVRINSIISKSASAITCVVEDVDMLSKRLWDSNTISISEQVTIFRVNTEGEALIFDTSRLLNEAAELVNARFKLNERDDRVKFEHAVAPSITEGDIVSVDSNGNLVKFKGAGSSDIKVGTVIERLKNGKDVYIKPFNDIVRYYQDPESLTGNPGNVYYNDAANPGDLTLTANDDAAFMQLNSSIPTTVTSTNSNIPGAVDTVIINGITVFDGPGGDSVVDLSAFANLLNTFTASTNVTANSAIEPASVSSDDPGPFFAGSGYYSSDCFIATGVVGGTQTYGEITISDGNNTTNVIFDNPDDTSVIGGNNYNIISPTAIKTKLDAEIAAAGLDLVVTVFASESFLGDAVKIETTGTATEVTLTNVTNGSFNRALVGTQSWTGIGLTATLGNETLTLTRASGGEIRIDGTPLSGGYINQGGIVSSNNGRVPYLLLVESTGGGAVTSIEGIGTEVDLDQTPIQTSGDGSATGIYITYTPWQDSIVQVRVNGIDVNLGNGSKTKSCYFSHDGGINARLIKDIQAGDQLYWNASIAGYELDDSDDVDVMYEAASNDL